ncbi:MAG TPA: peptidoglycan-binding protein [Polyangiaceae bacterium]|nr:peptidoglycan-binding protein [Polyangiaceae bacterium]
MPAFPLKLSSKGPDVVELQKKLKARGFPLEIDGKFGTNTRNAVRAFQSQNLDQNGQPLLIDGSVGELTWWSLTHAKPSIVVPSAVDFTVPPSKSAGGTSRGRAALEVAIGELKAGAGEVGGNNKGPFVKKYLNGKAPEGSNWCAGFVSHCFAQGKAPLPLEYSVGGRAILGQLSKKGWAHKPNSGYQPEPGDIVVWWREKADGWMGHIGLVYQLQNGMLYTIEGNKSAKVQGFSYVFTRMEQLLGFGRIP